MLIFKTPLAKSLNRVFKFLLLGLFLKFFCHLLRALSNAYRFLLDLFYHQINFREPDSLSEQDRWWRYAKFSLLLSDSDVVKISFKQRANKVSSFGYIIQREWIPVILRQLFVFQVRKMLLQINIFHLLSGNTCLSSRFRSCLIEHLLMDHEVLILLYGLQLH